ncbi:hypothetical protein GCM10023335_88810 [Streptomyces siamensis]|uniref:Uncharacterized protein n=1 Tax=Streptomyces siamensis TaxID=1274986 RepID=A0ABP9JRR4_9ACTN
MEQGIEQRLARGEVTQQRGEPDVGPACDVAQGHVDALLADGGARYGEQVVAVLPGIGPHLCPLTVRIGGPCIRVSGPNTWITDPDKSIVRGRQGRASPCGRHHRLC